MTELKNRIKTKFDNSFFRYTGEELPNYHLFSVDIKKIFHCPQCGRRFETVEQKPSNPEISTTVHEEWATHTFEEICFYCDKEWKFDLFIGWYSEQFDVSLTVTQTRDINTEDE